MAHRSRILLIAALLAASAHIAEAAVLCSSHLGHLRLRERCPRHEMPVDVRELLASAPDAVPLQGWDVPPDPAADLPAGLEAVAATNSSTLVDLTPCRLVDTRPGLASALSGVDIGPFADETIRTYSLEGSCGIPTSGVEAVSINLAIVPGQQSGFASVGPGSSLPAFPPGPSFASINYQGQGSPISNSLIVPVDSDGEIDVYVARSADVVIDTNGYFAGPSDDSGNTAFGEDALTSISTGHGNTAFGHSALEFDQSGFSNTAVGDQALQNNTSNANTAVGDSALASNTTGTSNTCVGHMCLANNQTGTQNAGVGTEALSRSTGNSNTAVGWHALYLVETGHGNVAVGQSALDALGAGVNNANVGVGANSLGVLATGGANTAIGNSALGVLPGGFFNIALGDLAGSALTSGNSNILIGNAGQATESDTIRIGDVQTATYIAGIDGQGVDQMTPVYVGSDGKLGTQTDSSRAKKQDIEDLSPRSRAVLDLRPVSFAYRDSPSVEHFGLIAEEAAEVLPEIVVFGEDGAPIGVRYAKLTPLVVSELKRAHELIAAQAKLLESQARRLDELEKEAS